MGQMLCQFLEKNRDEIVALTEEKTLKLAGRLPSSAELRRGLPIFFEHLIDYLKSPRADLDRAEIVSGAADHGRELLKLNYSLAHVVHAYGAMCQAITELAQRRNANISSKEFNELNLCLDVAIASAVSEFQYRSVQASEKKEVQHLGFLAHELRNALSSATIAHGMITKGLVGTNGSTSRVLRENLNRMRVLIDRSLSEVRMRAEPELQLEKFSLNGLIDQILLTAEDEASTKKQVLRNDLQKEIEVETDRQLLLSVLANLTQNALKYSKIGGQVILRAGLSGETVIIEVEDECGGLPSEVARNLFKPFASGGVDQSGLGLGLTIVQRAVGILQGKITVRDNPGQGCAFIIEIPKKLSPTVMNKPAAGFVAAQPKNS